MNNSAVSIVVPNWVKSISVEIEDVNVKFCSRLVVKDNSGKRLFEAVRPMDVIIMDGDYSSFKP